MNLKKSTQQVSDFARICAIARTSWGAASSLSGKSLIRQENVCAFLSALSTVIA
jgi:hypothetical protein